MTRIQKNLFAFLLTLILLCLIIMMQDSNYFVGMFLPTSSVSTCLQAPMVIRDISLEKILPTPDDMQLNSKGVYLISYAANDEIFLQNQNALTMSALNKNIDFFYNYRRKHIDSNFFEKNKKTLNSPKGAGFWLWKPYFILKTLQRVPNNSIIIYCDTGFIIKDSIETLINQLKNKDIILFKTDPTVHPDSIEKVANEEILIKMKCDDSACRKAPQIWGGISIYKNTPRSRKFVEKWLKACEDENLLQGISIQPLKPHFIKPEYDQALLSILAYQESKNIHFETVKGDWVNHPIFLWHHRHPSSSSTPSRSLFP